MKPVFGVTHPELYLDNAATTMIDPDVALEMRPFIEENYGNPETSYHLGRQAKEAVQTARERVADLLECPASGVFFTSGGTESNNWALKCFPALKIAASAIEHVSVLRSLEFLNGKRLPDESFCSNPFVVLPVDKTGLVDLEVLKKELEDGKTDLVSIQYANNEIGTVQPIKEISKIVHAANAALHVDAVQAFGKIPFSVEDDGIDMLSISAHKIHGPMGVGALYVRHGLALSPLFHGGGQEDGMRAGTLPVHQIVGFGAAAEKARVLMKQEDPRQRELLTWMMTSISERSNGKRNGHPERCLPGILNVVFPGIEATLLAEILDGKFGICVSCGAACSRGNPSHVLKAIGLDDVSIRSSLRISIGRFTKREHIQFFLSSLQAAFRMVRERTVV